ncbi:unnamed protein product [Echinostoma caproni]|uniref:mitogen-activated protein kinase kinase n=1 Tax=Echinostoma caproni TaxID=27848 RepID=A0A183BCG3_9TREM|nr:unnamed protein product [Echinostoma caproni]
MVHRPTQRMFAVKHIPIHQENTNKAQIQKDLAVGMRSRCPSVVTCYCGLCYELEVLIVMELMDTSLDKLLEKVNAAGQSFPESILAYIVHCVVTGLEYLHQELKIIHRDVKPSNILASRKGAVKTYFQMLHSFKLSRVSARNPLDVVVYSAFYLSSYLPDVKL